MKQIRIQSDGSGSDTVVTLPDGREVKGVMSATIWLEAKEVNRVQLELLAPGLDVHADLGEVTMTCTICGTGQTHYCPESKNL